MKVMGMNKAAILAAGDSTRMLPLSAYVPKHVLPVGGKALIHHTLAALRDAGVKEVLIVCGYHQDRLREHVNPDQWAPLEISFVTQEQRRGTAHAAAHARKFAGEDEIVIVYGDVIFGHGTLQGLIRKHDPSRSDLTICTVRVEDPSSYGIILAEKGRAVGLVEKPSSDQISSNLANAGIYVAGPALWEAIDATQLSPRGEYEITDSISLLIKRDRVDVYETSTWWLDIGRPWDLLRA
ncbi:MAG: sugar phosphate nucleotidyltransferase, partial [Candidatus Thorarchaeota archaeon]